MASASTSLTLGSFQSIASSNVNLGCILAYNNSRLGGCQNSDFLSGTGCSANCQRSIRSLEAALQVICSGVEAPSGSVLASAMQGSLVNTLCGKGLEASSSSRTTVVTTTATRQTNAPILSTVLPPTSTTTSARTTTTSTSSQTSTSTVAPRQSSTTTKSSVPKETSEAPAPAPIRGGGSPFDAQVARAPSSPAIPRLAVVVSWTFALLLLMR